MAHNLVELSEKVAFELLIDKITRMPRELLNIPCPVIEEGQAACLTVLDPNKEWELNHETNRSRSNNSPYWKKQIKGKVVAVFKDKHMHLDQ